MKLYNTNEIRNIALVGGTRCGKTILAESMLFEGGVINRRGTIETKNTVSDYKDIELERESSVITSILYAEYKNHKINIMDTPGPDDFVGEVLTSLAVSDTAVFVLNAQHGVEVGSEISWRNISTTDIPKIIAVNQLDHEKSNFDDAINQAKAMFGNKVTIIQYPINEGTDFNSIIDIIKMKMLTFDKEGKVTESDIPDGEKDKAEELQALLIEAAAESDEALMEKFFEEDTLSVDEVRQGIKAGIIQRGMFPVLCVSAKENMGVARLMDFIINSTPTPTDNIRMKISEEKSVTFDSSTPIQLYAFKTSTEPHLGEVTYFRATGGTMKEGADLINVNSGSKERFSQLFIMAGNNRTKVDTVNAGDIFASIKLKDTKTGHTLGANKDGEEIIQTQYPEPRTRTAIKAINNSDDEKLGGILKQMHFEDRTLLVEQSVELRQTIVSAQGELHLNMVKWYIENKEKIEIEFVTPKIPYRETITKPAKASYRHKKQSGGAGQFGEVYMLIQPYTDNMKDQSEFPIRGRDEHTLKWGGKLMFHNCIVGGAIDARFLPAILKGIMEKMDQGPLTGSYARDIVVNVYDGKMHPVDSNEISFKLAGRNAFREAFKNAGPKILEPIYDVEVVVPEERMGDVMTDLQGRRAIIQGMDGEGNYQRIKAKVPLAEMNRYSTTLSSITSGRATYGMKFGEYLQTPPDVQDKLLKTYEAESEEDE